MNSPANNLPMLLAMFRRHSDETSRTRLIGPDGGLSPVTAACVSLRSGEVGIVESANDYAEVVLVTTERILIVMDGSIRTTYELNDVGNVRVYVENARSFNGKVEGLYTFLEMWTHSGGPAYVAVESGRPFLGILSVLKFLTR